MKQNPENKIIIFADFLEQEDYRPTSAHFLDAFLLHFRHFLRSRHLSLRQWIIDY